MSTTPSLRSSLGTFFAESQLFQLRAADGKVHYVWARSDRDAIQKGRAWAGAVGNWRKHGGLVGVTHLTPQPGDNEEGVWERASRRDVPLSAFGKEQG